MSSCQEHRLREFQGRALTIYTASRAIVIVIGHIGHCHHYRRRLHHLDPWWLLGNNRRVIVADICRVSKVYLETEYAAVRSSVAVAS